MNNKVLMYIHMILSLICVVISCIAIYYTNSPLGYYVILLVTIFDVLTIYTKDLDLILMRSWVESYKKQLNQYMVDYEK